jgi:putative transposase
MSRGNNKQAIFADDQDCARFLTILARVASRLEVRCYAYGLMWNHYHLLLEPGPFHIWRMMQQLNSQYCQWFNKRHGRVGHLLGGRYKSPIVDSDIYFLRVVRYIIRNPVAAKLVAGPEEWQWSSYRATIGLSPTPEFLDIVRVLTPFDTDSLELARQRLVCYVNDGTDDEFWAGQFLVDAPALASRVRPKLEAHRDNEDFSHAHRFSTRPTLWDLMPRGCARHIARSHAKVAFFEHAYTLREIGVHLNRPTSTIWRWVHDG